MARDATLIRVAYRHGLRVSERVRLRWDQVDLQHGLLHVTRRKHGIASVHPLLRALHRLQRDTRRRPTCSSASVRRR
ncbi:Integrase family protein (fragment) [Candidatus Contendobacter odensis Run_B_J11]|uniref:Integrase family protein n=1 Tax=Candidatus Contendobacter odensis Run_B_J11 TaxID=1400861 RepID=A0A7U7GB00_9GAMM